MNRLLRLLADNRLVKDAARRFEVVDTKINAVSNAVEEATVYLYDMIVSSAIEAEYWGGVAAETFVRDFVAITAPTIHLRINSPGGDVFAARAMEQAVRNHPSNVIVHVDGYAASAATYLALAGDEIEIADGGFFMIHNSWSGIMGNADDLRQHAGLLDQIDNTIVATYAKRTNLDEAEIRAMLAAETWIGAQDAVKYGFADRVANDGAKNALNWNVSALLPTNGNRPAVAPPKQEAAPTAALVESRARAERMLNHVARIAA